MSEYQLEACLYAFKFVNTYNVLYNVTELNIFADYSFVFTKRF